MAVLLTVLLAAGSCGEPTAPGLPHVGYELIEVDGQPLPTQAGYPEGYLLVRRDLVFMPAFDGWNPTEEHGEVRMTSDIVPPGFPLETHETLHQYTIRDGRITINLCPIGWACIALISADLSGRLGTGDLILEESIGGQRLHSYRFRPVLGE